MPHFSYSLSSACLVSLSGTGRSLTHYCFLSTVKVSVKTFFVIIQALAGWIPAILWKYNGYIRIVPLCVIPSTLASGHTGVVCYAERERKQGRIPCMMRVLIMNLFQYSCIQSRKTPQMMFGQVLTIMQQCLKDMLW